MEKKIGKTLRWYLLELFVYSGLIACYCFVVLRFLAPWLYRLFQTERQTYASVALGLIVAQGVLLELVTRMMLAWINPRKPNE